MIKGDMMEKDTKSKLNTIFNYYGRKGQEYKLVEEMAELTQAIIKNDRENIIEEMVDVQNILLQLRLNFNSNERKQFAETFNKKIERQLNRIESEKIQLQR